MRLTLRTLLAYLDDTLDPLETKQIGQKVAESESARELIARIKQATRRRSITAPDSDDNDFEPNIVADYLDNSLPSEQIAQVEKLCLESDVHLAEVAACHQILALVLGEPASVPPPSRQRMYALVKGPEAIPGRKPRVVALASDGAATRDEDDEADETLLLGLPSYRQRGSLGRQLLAVAAVVVLLGGLAVVLYQAIAGRAQPPAGETPVVRGPAGPPAPVGPNAGREPPPVAARAPVSAEEWDQVSTFFVLLSARGTLPVLDRSTDLPPPVAPAPQPIEPAPKPTPPAPGAVSPPSDVAIEVGTYSSRNSLLFKQPRSVKEWQLVRAAGRVLSSDLLVTLPGYRSEINLDSKVRLELVGNLPEITSNYVFETAVIAHESFRHDLDLTLERGRIILSNNRQDGAVSVRVRFHDQAWDVRLLEASSVVGLELNNRIDRTSRDRWVPRSKLSVLTIGGPIELKRGASAVEQVPPGTHVAWDNLVDAQKIVPYFPLPEPPEWMRKNVKLKDEVRLVLTSLERRVPEKLDRAVKPKEEIIWIRLAFEELLEERRRLDTRLALFSLGALDQMDRVLAALDNADRLDIRDAAQITLWHWLGRKTDQDARLRGFLQKDYSDDDAVNLLRLLRGVDGATPANFEFLISLLAHDKLALRDLAMVNLHQLVPQPQRPPFDPTGSEEQRAKQAAAWKARFLPRPAGNKP